MTDFVTYRIECRNVWLKMIYYLVCNWLQTCLTANIWYYFVELNTYMFGWRMQILLGLVDSGEWRLECRQVWLQMTDIVWRRIKCRYVWLQRADIIPWRIECIRQLKFGGELKADMFGCRRQKGDIISHLIFSIINDSSEWIITAIYDLN